MNHATNTAATAELAACPFCNSDAYRAIYSGAATIFCSACPAMMGGEESTASGAELALAWNRRATQAGAEPVALRYRKAAFDDVWNYCDVPSKSAALISQAEGVTIEYLAAPDRAPSIDSAPFDEDKLLQLICQWECHASGEKGKAAWDAIIAHIKDYAGVGTDSAHRDYCQRCEKVHASVDCAPQCPGSGKPCGDDPSSWCATCGKWGGGDV